MKILVHTIFYKPDLTGTAKYTAELCEWLAARGHEVHVAAPPPYYPQWRIRAPYRRWGYRSEDVNGVRVMRCPIWLPKRPGGPGRILYGFSFLLASVPVMLKEVLWGPDVTLVIEPSFLNVLLAWPIARMARSVAWLHIQDFEIDLAYDLGQLRAGRRIASRIERWLLRRLDVVSSITRRMLDKVQAKGAAEDRCYLLPNWFDPEGIVPLSESRALRSELGIPGDAVVAMFSGSLGVKQGVDFVIEAARALTADPRLFFLICGEGVGLESLKAQARGLANLKFAALQPADRLNELLGLADIHLLPQHLSATASVMPSKLIGMLASGRPVVALARAGTEIALMVENCGVVVEPGDREGFDSAIRRLAANETERGSLGEQARKRAMELFRQDVILPKFEYELLRRLRRGVAHQSVTAGHLK